MERLGGSVRTPKARRCVSVHRSVFTDKSGRAPTRSEMGGDRARGQAQGDKRRTEDCIKKNEGDNATTK